MEHGRIGARAKWLAKWLSKWLLLPLVMVIHYLLPNPETREPQIYFWLGSYLIYLAVLEFLSRNSRFYEKPGFRMVRIQMMLFLGSALISQTGILGSYLWFVYLWPLLSVSTYFSWRMIIAIYGEVSVLYVLSSIISLSINSVDGIRVFINLMVLLLFTIVFAESVKRLGAAESELRYAGLLDQIQEEIDSAINLQDILDIILRRAVELVSARDGTLMLLDEEEELRFRARFGDSLPAGKPERTFKPGEGVAGWVMQNRKPYICHDTRTDERFLPVISGALPIRSLVSVPIISHGTVLGVINVDSHEANQFSGVDANLLLTLANQAAISIERAELIDSLWQIGEKGLRGAADLHDYVAEAIHKLTRRPVALWRADERGEQARIIAFRGVRAEHAHTAVVDLDHSVTGRAIRSNQIVQIPDIQSDLDFQNKQEAAREGWQAMLAVPLLTDYEQAMGTISIYGAERRKEFSQWELKLLGAFASQAGAAIQHVERLQSVQQMSAIGRSLATLSESPEVLDETLRRIATAAARVLGADMVDLYQYEANLDQFILPPIMVGERKQPSLMPVEILPDDVVYKVAHAGETVYAAQSQGDPVFSSPWDGPRGERPEERFVVREGVVSSAAVPIKIGEEVLGVLFASYRRHHDFDASPELRQRIEAFANFAATAIRNARLLQQERNLRQQAETLREVSSAISSELELTETARKILTELKKVIPYKKASIQLIKGNSRSLVAYRGPDKPNTEWLLRPLSEDSLITEVVKSQKPVILPVVTEYRDWEILPETADVKSWVGLPLVYGKATIGVLTLDHDQPDFYNYTLENQLMLFGYQAAIAMNNANLVQEISLLQEVGAKVSATLDLDELLSMLVQGAIDLTDMRSGVVHVFDAKGEITDSFGYPKGFSHPAPRISENGYTRHIINTGQRVVVTDAQEDTKANPEIVRKGVRSFVGTPLILRDQRVIGVLYLNDDSIRKFTNRELSLLRTLADQAAIAIEHATLVERLKEERQERVEAIREIGFGITAGDGKQKVLENLLQRTLRLMKEASLGEIWLIDDSADCLRVEAAQGSVAADVNELRVGDGVVGRVALTGEPYLTKVVDSDPYFVRRLAGTQSELAVPLQRGDHLIGVLNIEHPQPNAFSAEDVPLLAAIGSHVVIALDNAGLYQHLHENLERRIDELEVLTELGRTVSNLSINEIVDLVYRGMSKIMALGDAQVQIALYEEAGDMVTFPLAVEQDDGEEIDRIRWGKRDARYRESDESEIVDPFLPRSREGRFGLTEYVIHAERPVLILDNFMNEAQSLRIQDVTVNVLPEFGRLRRPTHSWLGVPMMVGDRVIGVVSIQSLKQERAFDRDHVQVLTAIANQAAVAIENARLYTQLEFSFGRAESAQASLRAMAGGYVHRLNGALGFIPSSINAILEEVDADIQDVLWDIKGGVIEALEFTARMTDLVVDQELRRESVNLNLLLRTVAHKFRIPSSKVRIVWEIAPDLPEIMADTMFLTEVFNNLILNALEAMEDIPQKELRIGGHVTDTRHVEIWLSDKGCGILEEDLSKVFEPEYTTKPGKRGLGLWFCDTVIQAHSGHIDVNSEPGEGTTFTITLPVGGKCLEHAEE